MTFPSIKSTLTIAGEAVEGPFEDGYRPIVVDVYLGNELQDPDGSDPRHWTFGFCFPGATVRVEWRSPAEDVERL